MRALCLLLVLLAACADEPADLTIEGVDPVQTDQDLAPDATLQPETELAPIPEVAPEGTIQPQATLEPENSPDSQP